MHRPRSAADPRPEGRPFYIPPLCAKCGTPLALADHLDNPATPDNEVWHDEWVCPRCQDGLHMAWPAAEWTPDGE